MQDNDTAIPDPGQGPQEPIHQVLAMRVFFTRAARYLITAPEASWGWGSRLGVPWCSKCNESLRFVFVTDADPHVHISSYFKPKAVRCACFTKRATTRA